MASHVLNTPPASGDVPMHDRPLHSCSETSHSCSSDNPTSSDRPREWVLRQVIPSSAEAGKKILDEIIRQLEVHDWQPMEVFGIHLSIEEALVNAIKHGNRYDADKRVLIECQVSAERMQIEIEDEGAGFNPADVPDCTDDDRLEVPSGRGLMLMRNFMTAVRYNEKGNRVFMEKAAGSSAS